MVPVTRPRHPTLWTVAMLLLLVPVGTADDLASVPQDDAGSGSDAPDSLPTQVFVGPDVVHTGSSTGPSLDPFDHYLVTGEAGQRFEAQVAGSLGCFYLLDTEGDALGLRGCSYGYAASSVPLVVQLPYTGVYYLRIDHLTAATYRFAYSLTGAPPEVRLVAVTNGMEASREAERLPMPEGCHGGFVMQPDPLLDYPRFTDACYHMRTNLNALDTPHIDVLLIPPVSVYPERDLRTMREAIEMWDEGIHMLARQMGMDWLADGVTFDIVVDDDVVTTDPLWDPEIVVVATNPVGGIGIGTDPLKLFGRSGPCHGQPNPLAGLDAWAALPGFDHHHDDSGTYTTDCDGGGTICYAVNGAIDPVPGFIDFFGLFDLVAHEVGHCLTIGHVGDALDHKAQAVPYADIMAYKDQPYDKCVSTLDVAGFSLTMSRFLLETPLAANDGTSPARGEFHVQHPDDHWYASPTGLAKHCPQPDAGLVPRERPV